MPTPYFDLQVNGYAGVDFNQDDLSPEQLHDCCAALERDGVRGILATVITESIQQMIRRISRLVQCRNSSPLARRLIAGLHIEGPFLNPAPGFRGAHPSDAMLPATADAMRQLLDAGDGLVRMVTLAPEADARLSVTRLCVEQGVVVSAGHTDASLDTLRAAVDAGLRAFTHLGNGCPRVLDRHDNIIQRVLSLADHITCCFIADGVHVPFFALKNYLNCAGVDRCVIVTDAISAAGMGSGTYKLGRWTVEVGEDLAAWEPGRTHLLGSAGTMRRTEENLRKQLCLDAVQCERVLHDNPRRLLKAVN